MQYIYSKKFKISFNNSSIFFSNNISCFIFGYSLKLTSLYPASFKKPKTLINPFVWRVVLSSFPDKLKIFKSGLLHSYNFGFFKLNTDVNNVLYPETSNLNPHRGSLI